MMRLSRHIGLTVFNSVFMALIVVVGLDVVAEIIDET
ncbi:MAG: LPS export ABC transporter permease LptG, partial [Porticoccaceae bacterium]|nr:LPS export ABC transporter permease LptG [Porticoccaceae bacterium]